MRDLLEQEMQFVSGGEAETITVTGERSLGIGPSFVFEWAACDMSAAGIAAGVAWAVSKNYGVASRVSTVVAKAAAAPCMGAVAEVNHLLQYSPPSAGQTELDYFHSMGYGSGRKLMP